MRMRYIREIIHIETASVYDRHAKVVYGYNSSTPSPNSLLDCSYLRLYNSQGNIEYEILMPDRLVGHAWSSLDGKFILGYYSLGFAWDEGLDVRPGGFFVIDCKKNQIQDFQIPVYHDRTMGTEGMMGHYQDGYFQLSMGYDYLYVNPTERHYFPVRIDRNTVKDKKGLAYVSFTPFEGMVINPDIQPKTKF